MHIPINHRLRNFYRFLAVLAGAYLLTFGIVGAIRTWGDPFFDRGMIEALGLRTNLAFSLLSIVVGGVVLIGALLPGNIAHYITLYGGAVFMLVGMGMLAFLQTELNKLNFQVSTCIVSLIIGGVMFTAGLYTKSGTQAAAAAEDAFRHSSRGAHVPATHHTFAAHPGVQHEEFPPESEIPHHKEIRRGREAPPDKDIPQEEGIPHT